ncbi:hypothetical protein PF011_g30147 [Phytophthora fragariae]|uniref:Uncharacterized protein n=1 Tax=Phytophthora fragariae TaxID=53985 RepID=A0A6A3GTN1_9STRA|nr:hypothetical protein PF011_g30147 [Phytophthora fragariae]
MVRVPGSSGDSGFHRESQEEVKVKIEQGDQASSDLGSTTTPLNEARPADRQSAGRNSIDGKETDPDPDLEDKPQPPPQVPSGTPVSLESHRDPLTKQTKAGQNRYAFADSPVKLSPRDPTLPLMSRWEWEAKVPAKWTALKAPDLEEEPKERQVPAGIKTETSTPTWNKADLEFRYYRKEIQNLMTQNPIMRILQPTQIGDQTGPVTAPATADNKLEAIKILMNLLQEAGLVAGAFDADDLFRPDLRIFQLLTKELFDKLKVILGEKVTDPSTTSSPDLPTQIGSTGDRTSSPFVSAAEADSDASSEPRRMSLGPSCAAMLHARSKVSRQKPTRSKSKKASGTANKPTTSSPHLVITTDDATTSTDKIESYFQAAMSRFLREQEIAMPNLVARTLPNPGTRDVEMESAGSDDLKRLQWEYDPEDLDLLAAAPAAVATAAVRSSESTRIQRVRISAISDLNEFTGKDQDEDRARAWISKVKSSLMRDQASDEEKCIHAQQMDGIA